MKRSVWPKSLVLLILMAGVTVAPAQTASLRPTTIASSAASLGRPIAVTTSNKVSGNIPRPFPISGELVPVNYTTAQPVISKPIATAEQPRETTAPGIWPIESHDPNGSEFAADRPVTAVRTVILPAGARTTPSDELIPAPRSVNPNPMPPGNSMPVILPPGQPSPYMPHVGGPANPPVGDFAPQRGTPQSYWPGTVPAPCNVMCESPMGCDTQVLPEKQCCWYDSGHRPFYFRGEYLLWWANGFNVPPLATTSAPIDAGFLGRPSTQILSDDQINRGAMSGGRFTFGYWFECEHALEVSGFFLSPNDQSDLFRGTQYPVLSRPFFSLNQNSQFSEIVSFPGFLAGDLSINSDMSLWGLEANLRCNLCCSNASTCDQRQHGYRVDAIFGPRYLELSEGLTIQEDILGLASNPDPRAQNQQITVLDSFGTRNQFFGGQVGLDAEWRKGRWSFGTRAKLGMGVTHQTVNINGSQRLVSLVDGSAQTFQGGLLALNSNIGSHSRDRFSIVPEVTFTMGYDVLDHVRVFGGYNFLYWSNVVRPGDQIDTTLDQNRIPNFLPGAAVSEVRPAVPFRTSDFWAQGLTLGLEIRY